MPSPYGFHIMSSCPKLYFRISVKQKKELALHIESVGVAGVEVFVIREREPGTINGYVVILVSQHIDGHCAIGLSCRSFCGLNAAVNVDIIPPQPA